jgi:hypothetical protein
MVMAYQLPASLFNTGHPKRFRADILLLSLRIDRLVLVEFKPERKDTLSMPRLCFFGGMRLTFHLKYDRKTLPHRKNIFAVQHRV